MTNSKGGVFFGIMLITAIFMLFFFFVYMRIQSIFIVFIEILERTTGPCIQAIILAILGGIFVYIFVYVSAYLTHRLVTQGRGMSEKSAKYVAIVIFSILLFFLFLFKGCLNR